MGGARQPGLPSGVYGDVKSTGLTAGIPGMYPSESLQHLQSNFDNRNDMHRKKVVPVMVTKLAMAARMELLRPFYRGLSYGQRHVEDKKSHRSIETFRS